jgi:hypothetical protein
LLNAAFFIIVFLLCLPNPIFSIQTKKGKGKKKKEIIKAVQAKISTSDKGTIKVDCTQPDNYAKEFFIDHRVSKKKTVGALSLKQDGKGSQSWRTHRSLL